MSIVVAEVGAAEQSVAVEIIGLSGRYSAELAAEREEVQEQQMSDHPNFAG